MVKKKDSRQRDVKSKLMAAVSMLLVSTLMLMSSTYAWFTLSTAPEVTGITTAVGANGNLEMALLSSQYASVSAALDAITSQAGDGNLTSVPAKNITWGNLVTLSDATTGGDYYGLNTITLYPSALNESDGTLNTASLLSYPQYGSDGRVTDLGTTTLGLYDGDAESFVPSDNLGVRGVGFASGMTDQQLAYRNARSTAAGHMATAKTTAKNTLKANGTALANLAIAHGLADDATFTWEEIAPIGEVIDDLETALDHVEQAYMQYILALSASAEGSAEAWMAVKGIVDGSEPTLENLKSTAANNGVELPEEITTGISKYETSVSEVSSAASKFEQVGTKESYVWGDFSGALAHLMNAEQVRVNGFTVAEVKADTNQLVSSYMNLGTLTLSIATGGGVLADIADQCGDYSASITMDVTYGTMELTDVPATMATASTVSPSYLAALGAAATAAGAPSDDGETKPLTELYGYVVDMAFRTNAAASYLRLQTEAIDRIYTDNNNEDTMGGGSNMTFTAAGDLSLAQVQELVGAIRIVFFDPESGDVYARAALRTTDITDTAGEITADMYLTETTASGSTTEYVLAAYVADSDAEDGYSTAVEGQAATHAKVGNDYVKATYVVDSSAEDGYRAATDSETATHVKNVTLADADAIMELGQNEATALSVLVYLDGNNITNAAVSATGTTSLSGKLNLQFSSSTTLVPMEYAELHTTNTTSNVPNGGNTGGSTGDDTPVETDSDADADDDSDADADADSDSDSDASEET